MTQETFEKIKYLVGAGYSIEKACKASGIVREVYYYQATQEQKNELKKLKLSVNKTLVPDFKVTEEDEI